LLLFKISCTTSSCENGGEWIELENNYRKYPFSDISVYNDSSDKENFTVINERIKKWMKQACPAESRLYSCPFQGKLIELMNKITNRVWKSKDTSCHEFWVSDFLDAITSKNILLIGDSLMFQIYSSLICELLQFVDSKLYMNWETNGQDNCKDEKNHCVSYRASFFARNISIFFRRENTIKWNFVIDSVKLDTKLTEKDIVIVSTGLSSLSSLLYH